MSKGLLRSVATVGGSTLLSRILGFVRDIMIARAFGAGIGADAFFVAFRIPNFLRRLFAEGAFSQAFVPVLSEYRSQRSHAEVRELTAQVSGTLGAILFLVTLVGVIAAPLLIMVFAPGFVGQAPKYALAVEMVRITFPYVLFISLVSFAAGILNTYGRFAVPAFTPVFLNLSLIAATIWIAPRLERPIVALAWGVLIAGCVQLAFQLPFLARLGLLVRPGFRWGHAGVRRILRLILPAVFGVSVSQINLVIDTLIASFLVTGSVSWLYFSDRLVEFPLGVFGIALATVILPELSRKHAQASDAAFGQTLDWALRWVLLVTVPAAVGLGLLAEPILATLFQYGEFSGEDVRMAARSLVAYASGLIAFVYVKVLAPGYFARQDMRTPVRVGVIAMLTNIVLNLALVVPLAHAGLALATSVAAFVNAGLLYRGLRRQGVYVPGAGWRALFLKVCVANLVMAAILWMLRGELPAWLAAEMGSRVLQLTLAITSGAAAYGVALWLMGIRPRDFLRAPA